MNPRLLVALAALLALGGIIVAMPAPQVRAGEAETNAEPPAGDDGFVRFELADHRVSYDDTVSIEPISRATVTKVAFGRISKVEIITTPSGTYSSDALTSPHVRYPGITVERIAGAARTGSAGSVVSFWRTGFGWLQLPLAGAGSFVLLNRPDGGGRLLTTEEGSCFVNRHGTFC